MTYSSRSYGGSQDLLLIQDFLVGARSTSGNWGYLHVGDVLWRIFRDPDSDPEQNIQLWVDDNANLMGFAFFCPPNAVEIQVHPRIRGRGELERDMLAWAEKRRNQSTLIEGEPMLVTDAFEDDESRIAILKEHGFRQSEASNSYLFRDLEETIPEPRLPTDFTFQTMGDVNINRWVALHKKVMGSRITAEAYESLKTAPGYRSALHIVAVAPDDSFAAYCLCWLDATNRTGELEPVGTHAAFRRQGLGKAVVLEGLSRLRQEGAKEAIVYTGSTNDAALKLYESVGFRTLHQFLDFAKWI